jgi:hypothetical protein
MGFLEKRVNMLDEPPDVWIARALLEGIENYGRSWRYLLPAEGAYPAAWLVEKRKPADWKSQIPGTDAIGYTNVLLALAHSLGLGMANKEQPDSYGEIIPNEEYEIYFNFNFHVKFLKEVLFRFYSQHKPSASGELWDREF